MLYNLILAVHVIVCIALIIVVLLQSSKGGGLAGAFGGGGGGQTMFGGQETATFLGKTTQYLAILFMVLSLVLALLSSRQNTAAPRSVMREAAENQSNVIPSGQSIDAILGASDTTSAGGFGAPADTTGGSQ